MRNLRLPTPKSLCTQVVFSSLSSCRVVAVADETSFSLRSARCGFPSHSWLSYNAPLVRQRLIFFLEEGLPMADRHLGIGARKGLLRGSILFLMDYIFSLQDTKGNVCLWNFAFHCSLGNFERALSGFRLPDGQLFVVNLIENEIRTHKRLLQVFGNFITNSETARLQIFCYRGVNRRNSYSGQRIDDLATYSTPLLPVVGRISSSSRDIRDTIPFEIPLTGMDFPRVLPMGNFSQNDGESISESGF